MVLSIHLNKGHEKNKVNHQPLTHNRNTLILSAFLFGHLHNELQNKIIQGETIKKQPSTNALDSNKITLYKERKIL